MTTSLVLSEWCSIQTLSDGFWATKEFWKYCKHEDNEKVWSDAISCLDENGDGSISFDETPINPSHQRELFHLNPDDLFLLNGKTTRKDCNDCADLVPDDCKNSTPAIFNPAVCQKFTNTPPLGDEELLRVLANAMVDSYCPEVYADQIYTTCPMQREGDTWLERNYFHPYHVIDSDTTRLFLLCILYAGAVDDVVTILTLVTVLNASNASRELLSQEADVADFCADILNRERPVVDRRWTGKMPFNGQHTSFDNASTRAKRSWLTRGPTLLMLSRWLWIFGPFLWAIN